MSSATHDIPASSPGTLAAIVAGLCQLACSIPDADTAVTPNERTEQPPAVAVTRAREARARAPALEFNRVEPSSSEPSQRPSPPGDHVSALFPYTRTEVLAAVALREDHPNPTCRSPLGLLRALRGDLQRFTLDDGACVATLAAPGQDIGASLQFRCPVRRTGRLCTEYFQGFVWLTLESETALRPYSATYSLEGVSRGYLHCRRPPELPNITTDESTRKLPAEDLGYKRLDGTLFSSRAADCPPGP